MFSDESGEFDENKYLHLMKLIDFIETLKKNRRQFLKECNYFLVLSNIVCFFRVSTATFYIFFVVYTFISLFGFAGNLMIISACLRNKIPKTTRNIFILNLAISDLLLCALSMPLTMMDLLYYYWPWGTEQVGFINNSDNLFNLIITNFSFTFLLCFRWYFAS